MVDLEKEVKLVVSSFTRNSIGEESVNDSSSQEVSTSQLDKESTVNAETFSSFDETLSLTASDTAEVKTVSYKEVPLSSSCNRAPSSCPPDLDSDSDREHQERILSSKSPQEIQQSTSYMPQYLFSILNFNKDQLEYVHEVLEHLRKQDECIKSLIGQINHIHDSESGQLDIPDVSTEQVAVSSTGLSNYEFS